MRSPFRNLFNFGREKPTTTRKPTSIVNAVLQQTGDRKAAGDTLPRKAGTVRAVFDIEIAGIRANPALLRLKSQHELTRHRLRDEDVEALVHAFAYALNYRDIFDQYGSAEERIEALVRQRNLAVMRSSEESYTNATLVRHRKAEEWVQRVHMEILSSFDKAGHGTGLSDSSIADKAEELAADWCREHKIDCHTAAQREYRHLSQAATDGVSILSSRLVQSPPAYKQFSIGSIAWMFPVEQSPSLRRLVDSMVDYKIGIVVPLHDLGSDDQTR